MTMVLLAGVRDALATRLGTTAGLPTTRYSGIAPIAPAPSVAYVEEDFTPATATTTTIGPGSEVARTGLYSVRLYSATGGASTLDALADVVLAVFPRGLSLAAADGTLVRISSDFAPRRGQIIATTAGRSAVAIDIAWWCRTFDP